MIADGLGCEAGDVKARWADIRGFKIITDPQGALTIDGQAALTIDGQAALIEALKHRARAAS